MQAAEKVKEDKVKYWDVYSPFPIHGMDDAMGLKSSVWDGLLLLEVALALFLVLDYKLGLLLKPIL